MNILKLSYKNMTSRPLSTTLSLVLLTLGVGLISLILQVNNHIQQQMENNVRGIDMVVGAKGSPLQLILSAVYHIDAPTGNISLAEAETLKKNRLVASGIPLSYGDSFEGYRIVGTTDEYPGFYDATVSEGRLWKKPFEVTIGSTVAKNKNMKIGDLFVGSHGLTEGGDVHGDHAYEVVGILNYSNSVIDQLILTATESVWEVHSDHDHDEEHEGEEHDHEGEEHEDHEGHDHEGEEHDHEDHEGHDHESEEHDHEDHEGHDHEGEEHDHEDHEGHDHEGEEHDHEDHEGHDHEGEEHDHEDHEGHDHEGEEHDHEDHEGHDHEGEEHDNEDHEGHDHEGEEHDHEDHEGHDHSEEDREITAMLIEFRNPNGIVQMPRMVNENTNMQAAVPAYEINRLFSLMGVGIDTLSSIALVIMVVSGFSVLISLYSALRDRKYEMALMRAYGSTRMKLVWLVLNEGLLLTFIGFILGIIFSRIGLLLVSTLMEADYHYSFSGWTWLAQEWWLLVVSVLIGFIASLLPAIAVFNINISKTLAKV